MIISHGRQFIFVHIPKTGGTSMAMALEARAMADDILIGDTPKAVKRKKRLKNVPARGRVWKHSTLRDIDGWIGAEEIARSTVFTLVRNPWDRLVSYYHWLREQSFDHPAVERAQTLPFDQFLQDPDVSRSLQMHSYPSYMIDATGQERCDLYIRLEHLDEDLGTLEGLIDLKLGELPHVNRSKRPEYRDAYTDKTQKHVADICAADIARFGYCF